MGHSLPIPGLNCVISVNTETMSFIPHGCIPEPKIVFSDGNSVVLLVKYLLKYLILKVSYWFSLHLEWTLCSLCLKSYFNVLKQEDIL